VTRDVLSARRIAERICLIWQRELVEAGPSSQLLNSDNPSCGQFLTDETRGPWMD
jgi:ABC-type transporter Mla maintaining outer membrane lipid asymmetry ATPase subunit MlaF